MGIFTVVVSPSEGALFETVSINVWKNKELTLVVLLLLIGIQTNKGFEPVLDEWIIINSPSVFELLYECNDGIYNLISWTSYPVALYNTGGEEDLS